MTMPFSSGARGSRVFGCDSRRLTGMKWWGRAGEPGRRCPRPLPHRTLGHLDRRLLVVASVGVRPRVPQPLIEAASGSTFDQPLDEPELTAELDHWERNQSHLSGSCSTCVGSVPRKPSPRHLPFWGRSDPDGRRHRQVGASLKRSHPALLRWHQTVTRSRNPVPRPKATLLQRWCGSRRRSRGWAAQVRLRGPW